MTYVCQFNMILIAEGNFILLMFGMLFDVLENCMVRKESGAFLFLYLNPLVRE